MKNIQKAIKRVHQIDALSKRTTILSAIHPTYKILIVLLYLIITASYSIHDLYILVMFLPLLLFSLLGEINLFKCLGELKPLVALLLFMGTPFLFFKGYNHLFYCACIKRNICFTILLHIDDHNIYGGTLYGII